MPFGTKGTIPTKEVLVDLYLNKRISKSKIMKIFKIGPTTLDKILSKYEIETRKLGTNQYLTWTFEKVKKEFSKRNYTLLETEYKNTSTKMKYRCHCGYLTSIVLPSLLNGRGCNKCANLTRNAKKKLSYEHVRETFSERGCVLVTKEYINSHTKLDYICHCGAEASMSYSNFRAGYDCANCKRKRFLGENNHNYNPELSDEDRKGLGRYEERYKAWRKEVYKNACYSCQVCSMKKSGELVAHHLEGYTLNPSLRTDPHNGVALCVSCHKEFHKQYGYGNNTREQFETFKDSFVI